MPPQDLVGETLGEKHRSYNKLVQEHVTQKTKLDENLDDNDISNLLKIDIACGNQDVEYILKVLKNEDMLYVSRALARCTWLITDQKYANIIKPDYLKSELYPNMTTKAMLKLKKNIRHNIKGETRAEQFYLNENNKAEACKWLPHCSVAFIENNIEKHFKPNTNSMKLRLYKRLCEKSITIFEIILKHIAQYERRLYLQAVTFFLHNNVDRYLDVLESSKSVYLKLNHKATKLIMMQSPNRVKDKIEMYVSIIHIPTFVKYLEANEIETFLFTQAKKAQQIYEFPNLRQLFRCDNLKHFIRRLPKHDQYNFVKKVCMYQENKNTDEEILSTDSEIIQMKKICSRYNQQRYIWYQFAPFEYAFEEITKLISENVDNHEKRAMLSFLITCTDQNLEHIQMVLNHYINKHKNEDFSAKLEFATDILKQTDVTKYDETTWNILNKWLTSMNVYDLKNTNFSNADNKIVVNSIIIYNAINNIKTSEEIEKLFTFNTLVSYKSKMNKEQQNKIFECLYEYMIPLLTKSVTDEKDFTQSINTVENLLKLLQEWDKNLLEYPLLLDKVRQLIFIKNKNKWKTSLAPLYNVNKSWRKHMFEESVDLCPTEEVCLNALKHEPQLLVRHKDEVDTLKTDDKTVLHRFHAKIRIYWPNTLAQQWIDAYSNNISEGCSIKPAVRGICTMLTQKTLLDVIEKYKPESPKIDWKHTDDNFLNVQRLLAKNMHLSRPQPTPDAILSYAKGDYLQFALPSLLAIFYNLKSHVNSQYIPRLLDAPVSLQKHGIRIAFKTLDTHDLKDIFLNCWKTSKNASIRAIIFTYTHTLLCNEKDSANAASLWQLLELFINNLTYTENKDIYQLFHKGQEIPINVRAEYIVKTYRFVQKLIPNAPESDRAQYHWIITSLVDNVRHVMETISPNFVTSIIQEFIDQEFLQIKDKSVCSIQHSDGIIKVISAYLLCSKNEAKQIQKYETIFIPIMRSSFEKWAEKSNRVYFVRQHFEQLLTRLSFDLQDYVTEKNKMIPLKMFKLIQIELEKSLSVPENYMILTKWNLTVALANLLLEYATDNEKLCYEFGKICLEYLKVDVQKHFPCIYLLFSKSVKSILHLITPKNAMLHFYVGMLSDKQFVQGYLSALEIDMMNCREDEQYDKIWQEVLSHPSVEVKMHYYNKTTEKNI